MIVLFTTLEEFFRLFEDSLRLLLLLLLLLLSFFLSFSGFLFRLFNIVAGSIEIPIHDSHVGFFGGEVEEGEGLSSGFQSGLNGSVSSNMIHPAIKESRKPAGNFKYDPSRVQK